MKKSRTRIMTLVVIVLALLAMIGGISYYNANKPVNVGTVQYSVLPTSAVATPLTKSAKVTAMPVVATVSPAPITLVGPRQGIPKDAPVDYGFWDFAMPVDGVLSRSGQPLMSEFTWLKDHGWKGDVDLRTDGEYNSIGDDSKLPGFNALGLHYLYLPMTDGAAPTDAQAQQYLDFVMNPANQPVEVHCRGGYGRTGTMVALYRYAVQGWPMEKAIEESRLFHGGVSSAQLKWLQQWAGTHPPLTR